MKKLKTETLIIGAGPAGLSCAMELSRAGKDFIVIEKSSQVGGLAKTYSFQESDGSVFYTDNGPHRFFSKNQYLYDFIENLIGEDWIKVKRQTCQYIDGKFYDYPVNAMQAVKNIGFWKSIKMGFDYILAKIRYGILGKKIENFEDYALANFGRSLAEFSIINYTEKIWGIPSSQIHPDWAVQRIKGLSLTSVAKNTLKKIFSKNKTDDKNNGPKSLVDEFFYPSKGTGLIYETISQKLKNLGYAIMLGTYPKEVRHSGGSIIEVLVNSPEGQFIISCRNLIESVPITEFIKLLFPMPPREIFDASNSLRHRHQVYLFITLNKEKITDDQWIYFPLKENKVARISEMKNFSSEMSPSDKTSVFVEFFCFEDDPVWSMSKDEVFEIAINELSQVGLFEREDVREVYHLRQRDVYPVYDLSYQIHLDIIKKYLDRFKNLYYIGRPGRFRYNNQDHSLEMGMLAAKCIIDGVRYDIEAIGNEEEYYERGSVPDKKS